MKALVLEPTPVVRRDFMEPETVVGMGVSPYVLSCFVVCGRGRIAVLMKLVILVVLLASLATAQTNPKATRFRHLPQKCTDVLNADLYAATDTQIDEYGATITNCSSLANISKDDRTRFVTEAMLIGRVIGDRDADRVYAPLLNAAKDAAAKDQQAIKTLVDLYSDLSKRDSELYSQYVLQSNMFNNHMEQDKVFIETLQKMLPAPRERVTVQHVYETSAPTWNPPPAIQYEPPRQINCTSNRVYDYVYTSCY